MLPSLLAHVRVLSVGHTLPAMYCIPALRDLGAEVTLIEAPQARSGGDALRQLGRPVSDAFPAGGHGRCTINLRDARGRDAYLRLARQADVILEGFRPGTSTRLGIDYDTVKAAEPGRDLRGHLRATGKMDRRAIGSDTTSTTWRRRGCCTSPTGPARPAGSSGGAVRRRARRAERGAQCRRRLVAARADRRRRVTSTSPSSTGRRSSWRWSTTYFWSTGRHRQRGDTHLCGGYPWYHVFETADGRYLSVAAVEPQFYARLCARHRAPRSRGSAVRRRRRAPRPLRDALPGIFRSKTCDEWMALLGSEDVCVAPVLTPGEAAQALRMRPGGAVSAEGDPSVRSPVRLEAATPSAPQGTAATLASFGFTEQEIRSLQEHGAIAD